MSPIMNWQKIVHSLELSKYSTRYCSMYSATNTSNRVLRQELQVLANSRELLLLVATSRSPEYPIWSNPADRHYSDNRRKYSKVLFSSPPVLIRTTTEFLDPLPHHYCTSSMQAVFCANNQCFTFGDHYFFPAVGTSSYIEREVILVQYLYWTVGSRLKTFAYPWG
jgi:hypothetical protein